MSTISRICVTNEATLKQVASIVSLLQKAVKIVCLYPPSNPTCKKATSLFADELKVYLESNQQLFLSLAEDGFTFEGELVEPTFGDSHRLSKMCYDAGMSEIEFSVEITSESIEEIFDIFRKVITKDEGELELAEALWGKEIPGLNYEIIEDHSYIEFDTDIQREFFSANGESFTSGYLSESEDAKKSYEQSFEVSLDDKKSDNPVNLSKEQVARFEKVVKDLSDDEPDEEAKKQAEDQSAINPRALMMRAYELDSKEAHESAMAVAKDSMFNADLELIEIINDLFEQDKVISDLTDTILSCVKAHTYFIERGSLKKAASILQKLKVRRDELHEKAPDWEAKISEGLSSALNRDRFKLVCDILNNDENITAEVFPEYLSTFDWTAYIVLAEALGELKHKAHRMALCDFFAQAKEEHVDLIASGLYDKRWYVARNTAMILSNFICAKSHRHLIKAMQHEDCRVRSEVLKGCVNHDSAYKATILQTAIVDKDADIRQCAIETALNQSGDEAFPLFTTLLEKLLQGKITESSGDQVIYGYSQAGKEVAVPKLAEIANDWKLIGRSPLQRFRKRAITALQDNPSIEAEKALQILSKSWCKEIKTLSLEALGAKANSKKEQS